MALPLATFEECAVAREQSRAAPRSMRCLLWEIIASKARYVTDTMMKATATELILHLPTQKDRQARLLPPISEARSLGRLIAGAVGGQAIQDGQAQIGDEAALNREIEVNIWEPAYVPYERKR